MDSRSPQAAATAAIPPILAMAIPFPATLFVAALLTDLAYWRTADPLWSTMSSWLLLAGLVVATAAVLAEMVRVLRGSEVRRVRPAWTHLLGNGAAVLLSVMNFVFHVRDGYSAVVPAGPLLSAAVVLVLLLSAWMVRGLRDHHPIAIAEGGAARRKES
jgi:uncharacterized membrane protein